MKPRIAILTLPVDDLERALRFYRDGLGLPTTGIADAEFGGSHILFEMEGGLSLVLFLRSALETLTALTDTGRDALACILSHAVASAGEVDAIMAQAVAAGGTIAVPAAEQSWGGYSGYFRDPDGNLWEIVSGLDAYAG